MSQLTLILITIPLCFVAIFILMFIIRIILREIDDSVKLQFKSSLTPEQYELFKDSYYGLENAFDNKE